MPTLNWITKTALIKHDKTVPFRLVEPVPANFCGDNHRFYSKLENKNWQSIRDALK